MCQVLFEVPEIHPGSKETKPLFVWSLDDPVSLLG